MKKLIIKLFAFFLILIMLQPDYEVNAKEKVERYIEDEFGCFRERKKFEVLASDVKDIKKGTNQYFRATSVFVSQKKGSYRIIDFTKKRGKKYSIRYKNVSVGTDMDDFVPISSTCGVYRDKSGKIKENGTGREDPLIPFKERKKIKKYWGNETMIAYVSNHVLKIRWQDYRTIKKYFKDEADKVKKVVAGNCLHAPHNVFVLMEDGSVWGVGNNENHMITNDSKKKYREFRKIISDGVKDICASANNVAVLRNDNSLWVWGKYRLGKKEKFSASPQKIDDNVRSFDMSQVSGGKTETILAYVKESGEAYGWGTNEDWSMSDVYKSKWQDKPVKLKEKISRVMVADGIMLLLSEDHILYWCGSFYGLPATSSFPVKIKKK